LELDSGLELDALRVLQLLLLGAAGLIMMMTDWHAYDYEIDIAAELQRVASEGVAILAGAECLQVQLAHTSNTMAFMPTVHWPGDGLEMRAALALQEVDELLLRQQTAQQAPALPPAAVEQLKLLQRHAQDVVVLVHCRYINQNILQCKSIPTELLLCLEATYGTGLSPRCFTVVEAGQLKVPHLHPWFAVWRPEAPPPRQRPAAGGCGCG
jgi:hypothetical protein